MLRNVMDVVLRTEAHGDERLERIAALPTLREREHDTMILAWWSGGLPSCDYDTDGPFTQPPYASMPPHSSLHGLLTWGNLDALERRYTDVTDTWGSIKAAYTELMKAKECAYPHVALATLLGGGTGFPTTEANSTFYRYNLMFYWLTQRVGAWTDVNTDKALLPCDNRIVQTAQRLRLLGKTRQETTIAQAIELTDMARVVLGNTHFYRLYEYLHKASRNCIG